MIARWMLRIGNGKLKGRGEEFGIVVPKGTRRRTLVLALAIVAATFMLVFIADYVFMTDFRIWTLDIRVFDFAKIIVAVKYLPFFLVFYLLNSLCCSRNCFENWSERKQILVSVGFNILAPPAYLNIKLQKLTGNIWLAGFVNALLVTMITVANTSFSFPY